MGISVTGVKPGNTTVTINSKTSPNISKRIPVTVKSRNLLAYGPAEGNGLTATVNSDGSLHVTGTATRQWRGVSWTFPCPVQGTVKFSVTSIAGLSFNIKCLDAKGQQLGAQMNLGNSVMAIPAGTVSLFLNVISNEATPTAKDGDLRVQLESGDTAHEWMRPDNTSLKGGGYELANLYPRVTGLPKTLGTDPGVMVTEPSPGTYRFKGSTTQKVDSWIDLPSSMHVDAGTYTMDATDWPLGSDSWLFGLQAKLIPDDGSGQTGGFAPRSYGARTLKAGTLIFNIFLNTTGEVDKTLTPLLYKLD
ncbi:hypothetical protein [Bifidobacterium breve]|uniref:Uncharacterized protein n=1 Tax=Bifidobacterium breve TaxID=1685 RepID=A0AAX3NG94_BIFBR|nr:hypothetical protein [Bifidobacterium breve]WEB53768.1 hypothetical protein PUW55_05985 [Bifidobacterium breve]